jgi:3-oxoadipate enol-lactonase
MERLGRDVLAVLDALGLSRINWCGLSMGGPAASKEFPS